MAVRTGWSARTSAPGRWSVTNDERRAPPRARRRAACTGATATKRVKAAGRSPTSSAITCRPKIRAASRLAIAASAGSSRLGDLPGGVGRRRRRQAADGRASGSGRGTGRRRPGRSEASGPRPAAIGALRSETVDDRQRHLGDDRERRLVEQVVRLADRAVEGVLDRQHAERHLARDRRLDDRQEARERLGAGCPPERAAPPPPRCGCRPGRDSPTSLPTLRRGLSRHARVAPGRLAAFTALPRRCRPSAARTASPNSEVVAVPPASGVGAERAPRRPRPRPRGRAPGSPRPCSSSSASERSIAVGFAAPVPAMSGAEPCTGSKIPGPASPRLADEARPRPPVTAAATSERMSPKVFSITSTSKDSGSVTMLHRDAVDEPVPELDVRVVGGELGDDPTPHARGVEHVRLVDRQEPAAASARELERPPRDPLDLARVVLAGVEDGAVVARSARAVVEAADELAHDQQVDPVARPPAAGSRRRRAPCAARSARPRAAPAPPSHSGPPTAPSRTASAATQAASVAGGSGSPQRVDRGAAERVLLDLDARAAAPRARAPPRAITSGPIPSPGRQTIALYSPCSSRRVRSSTSSTRPPTPSSESGPAFARWSVSQHRLLAAGIAQRDPVLDLVLVQPRAPPRAAG